MNCVCTRPYRDFGNNEIKGRRYCLVWKYSVDYQHHTCSHFEPIKECESDLESMPSIMRNTYNPSKSLP